MQVIFINFVSPKIYFAYVFNVSPLLGFTRNLKEKNWMPGSQFMLADETPNGRETIAIWANKVLSVDRLSSVKQKAGNKTFLLIMLNE